jgi:hypothetical protein
VTIKHKYEGYEIMRVLIKSVGGADELARANGVSADFIRKMSRPVADGGERTKLEFIENMIICVIEHGEIDCIDCVEEYFHEIFSRVREIRAERVAERLFKGNGNHVQNFKRIVNYQAEDET